MPRVARIGSLSDHGGVVTTGSLTVFAGGIGIARTGDLHTCPQQGHGITPLIGLLAPHVKVNGRTLVVVGDKAGCGARITTGSLSVGTTR